MKFILFVIVIIMIFIYFYRQHDITIDYFQSTNTPCLTGKGIDINGNTVCCPFGTFSLQNINYCNLQSCDSNSDCPNHACGRLTAKDNAEKICCPSGNIDTYGGYDYCTQMEDNSVCFSDAMCKNESSCIKPQKSFPSPYINCDTGQDSSPVCAIYALGSAIQETITNLTKKGICEPNLNKNIGDLCNIIPGPDSSGGCQYGCGYTSMNNSGDPIGNTVCCSKDQITVKDNSGNLYCSPFPVGNSCNNNSLCGTSSYCSDCSVFACSKDSVCLKLKQSNDLCDNSDECDTKACGRPTAEDGAQKICCPYSPGIGVDTYGGFDYCYRMKDGAVCYSNAMCESGTCEGGSIFKKGKCASSCGGQTCPEGTDCISQIKSDGTNFSTCCRHAQVGQSPDGHDICCGDGSLYDNDNKICRRACGDILCKINQHCANGVCVQN